MNSLVDYSLSPKLCCLEVVSSSGDIDREDLFV